MAQFEKEAVETLNTFARVLTNRGWRYHRHDEQGYIYADAFGEGLAMDIVIRANSREGLLQIFSKMPVAMSPDKMMEAAIIVNEFNDGRPLGNFDIDIIDGSIIFRICTCIADSKISEMACELLFDYTVKMTSHYSDQFLMLNKGKLPMEKILAAMNE